MRKRISGFSKFTKEEKINWLAENCFKNSSKAIATIKQYWNEDEKLLRQTF
jgi:hydroxymethylglutaryl-CoA reductase